MQCILIIFILHTSQIPLPPYLLSTSRSCLFIFERCVYYIYEFCMHGYMHTLCVPGVCRVRRRHKIPYNWSYRWSHAIPYGCRALNPSPLLEQEMLLTTESSFQPYLFMYLFYVITYWVQFELPIYPQEWGHPWSLIDLPAATALKQTDTPSPRSHYLPVVSQLGKQGYVNLSLLHVRMLTALIVFTGSMKLLGAHEYSSLVTSRRQLPSGPVYPLAPTLFLLLLCSEPWV